MRALVTGGAGFIGSTLVDRLLAEGHEVDVADDLSTGSLANLAAARAASSRALTIHHLDVRLPEVVELMVRRRPQVVFHLAAQSDVEESVAHPRRHAEVNVVGSLNVVEGALAAGTERVVYGAGAETLYGDAADEDVPIAESHPRRPRTPLGVSARAVIDYLAVYRQLHSLEFAALALAHVYGPRQRTPGPGAVVAAFAERMSAGEPVVIDGDGEQTRDFVHVDDVVDAFVRASSRGGGLVCNIGTGRSTSLLELWRIMASHLPPGPPPRHGPARRGELRHHRLDTVRASIQLGWRPFTPLADGTAELLRAPPTA